jgi:hypothetical protein
VHKDLARERLGDVGVALPEKLAVELRAHQDRARLLELGSQIGSAPVEVRPRVQEDRDRLGEPPPPREERGRGGGVVAPVAEDLVVARMPVARPAAGLRGRVRGLRRRGRTVRDGLGHGTERLGQESCPASRQRGGRDRSARRDVWTDPCGRSGEAGSRRNRPWPPHISERGVLEVEREHVDLDAARREPRGSRRKSIDLPGVLVGETAGASGSSGHQRRTEELPALALGDLPVDLRALSVCLPVPRGYQLRPARPRLARTSAGAGSTIRTESAAASRTARASRCGRPGPARACRRRASRAPGAGRHSSSTTEALSSEVRTSRSACVRRSATSEAARGTGRRPAGVTLPRERIRPSLRAVAHDLARRRPRAARLRQGLEEVGRLTRQAAGQDGARAGRPHRGDGRRHLVAFSGRDERRIRIPLATTSAAARREFAMSAVGRRMIWRPQSVRLRHRRRLPRRAPTLTASRTRAAPTARRG